MPDLNLVLDPAIRIWVFVPIGIIAFLLGIIRHYVSVLFEPLKTTEADQVKETHALIRGRLLHENGHLIPEASYQMRKAFFNDEEEGYFMKQLRAPAPPRPNPLTDPSMMTEAVKGNVTNVLPMMVIGGWINYTFSGFVTTRVPFPLTVRFKSMLQREVDLLDLDASWVSSASWYFLNVFGLQSLYPLVLGEDHAADQMRFMQDQISGLTMRGPQDMKAAFRSAWEDLECAPHSWTLKDSWKKFAERLRSQNKDTE